MKRQKIIYFISSHLTSGIVLGIVAILTITVVLAFTEPSTGPSITEPTAETDTGKLQEIIGTPNAATQDTSTLFNYLRKLEEEKLSITVEAVAENQTDAGKLEDLLGASATAQDRKTIFNYIHKLYNNLSNLVNNIIKKDTTIGGLTGTLTPVSGASPSLTAGASDVCGDKYFFGSGDTDWTSTQGTRTACTEPGLPDTNQFTCYNDTADCGGCPCTDWPRQTAQYGEDGNRENDLTVDGCGTGTVSDSLTGLCWERDASTSGKNWKAALQECNNLDLGGHTDWRLPKAIELVSIVDYGYENSSYWHTTKFTNYTTDFYWSGTTFPLSASYAYSLGFDFGYLNYGTFKTFTYYVVCVRQ